MAAGVTQPGGAGTTIYVYDDASSASGTGYTFTEISAAFPADFVDNGTNRRSYRAKVSVQIGDTTTNAATTTIQDTNCTVIFDSGKILTRRATQLTSWYLRLGAKVGTGDEASGKDGCDIVLGAAASWPPQMFIYGGSLRQTAGAMTTNSTSGISEFINVLIQSSVSAGSTPISVGSANNEFDNLYNVDISHATSNQVLSNFNALTASRITVSATAPTTFLQTAGPNVTIKDLAMFGSPTAADLRWSSAAAAGWKLIRPKWTGNAPKFAMLVAASLSADNGCQESWLYDVKCVDGAGAGVSGLPVKVTDNIGTVQVNTTTDSNGRITFGTGITANALVMMDHYAVSGTYTQRHRGPFLTEVNMSYQAGYNPNYFSHRYYWRPPGYDTITTSAGSFEDVTDILQMSAPSSGGSTWTETVVP